jgi:protein-S-isoprenylcysteine O-methyltransferase Ste14
VSDSARDNRAASVWRQLARLRVTLGFVFGVAVLWLAAPTPTTLWVGAAVAAVGEALRIWAAGHLNKSREVTSSGPYRWFAHPLYVGSTVIGVGLAVACASPAVFALITIYLGATLTAAVKSEEAFLRRTFGDRYDQYRRGRAAGDDEGRSFSCAQVRANREYRAVMGVALAVLLLVLKATYNGAFWRTAGTYLVRPGG